MSCRRNRSFPLPHGAVGWSVVCDCGISLSYSLTFLVETDSSTGYSKTCIKRPLKNRQNKDLNDKW